MNKNFCHIYDIKDKQENIKPIIINELPDGNYKKIVLKPNWVLHENHHSFPILALVTSTELIENVIECCLKKYKLLQNIIIGDVPLQSCDWDILLKQTGIDKLIKKYLKHKNPTISFIDLRKERVHEKDGMLIRTTVGRFGDPKGYRTIILDENSFLEPISSDRNLFRVMDYDPGNIINSHQKGFHRYCISASLLDCDLFINMPKMKTHEKAGITGALKNLVGINGDKSYLVHHRKGRPRQGGDEFSPETTFLAIMKARFYSYYRSIEKHNIFTRSIYKLLLAIWKILSMVLGYSREEKLENLNKKFVPLSGSWYGYDSVWRMVYDLNRIILFANSITGEMMKEPQREYFTILDGTIGGEGAGPLRSIPVKINHIFFSNNPFLLDTSMAQTMGFDWKKIPSVGNFKLFDHFWHFDINNVSLEYNKKTLKSIKELPVIHFFKPAPGWKGYIENLPGK